MNRKPNLVRTLSSAWRRARARCALALACVGLVPAPAFADFGLTEDPTFYTVDTDAGLVFKVRRVDLGSSTQSPGDLASIVYNGIEYQNPIRGSHINSGFDWLYNGVSASNVSAETVGSDIVKVVVEAGDLTHYYVARRGDSNIYMGTHFTSEPSVHGLVRYIMRIPSELLPDGPEASDIRNNTGAIESGDIFGLANGESRSKHYSNMRQMDWTYIGATGPNVGVWMVKGNEEGMSGGPFYRCLIAQTGGDQEVYSMVNYGEAQTEAFRPGILNLYTYVFNDGSAPASPDLSWLDSAGLLGWIPTASRGGVSGTATGVPAEFQAVVGFANATAQSWATVNPDGSFSATGMIPGDYTATLFKGELAVATAPVTILAGGVASMNIASTEVIDSAIFRIGDWDGTPAGFLNADKMTVMHPTDVRMDSWAQTSYTVGVDTPNAFPSIQARAANSPYTIKFNLAPNQVTNLTLKIGITVAYNGGRPQVVVNNSYTTPIINPSAQPNTRTITVGTYRGNNTTFSFNIPSSALVVGENTMKITPISGSADLSTWLSAGWVYDCVELVGPIATPVITYVGADPLVISGTSEPARSITVSLDGATVLGTTVADAAGAWRLVTSTPIPAGAHSVTAVADDGAGHNSPTSAAFAFNTGVTMPVIVSAAGDTGTYTDGATTSDRVFLFSGTAGAGDTVTLTRIGIGAIGTAVADAGGAWSFDYTTVSLPDGANGFYATAGSGANVSASSPVFTLNLSGAPRVAIERHDPIAQIIPTTVGSVVYRVTFNHEVSGVTTGAFALTTTGTASGTVAGVSASGGSVFDVTVSSLAGTGNVRLDLVGGSGVVDTSGIPEAGYGAGQAYSLVTPTTGNGTWIRPESGGFWSDALNWQDAVIADGPDNSANFATLDLTADNTVHLDSPRTLAGLTFADTVADSAANWTIDNSGNPANTLTLAGTAPTITVGTLGAGSTTTISAGLAGNGGLNKTGTGTLVLAGDSSLTGTLNVNAGTLRIAPGGSLALGNRPINTATNAVLNVAGGDISAGGLVSTATALVVDSGTATFGSFRTNAVFNTLLRVNGGLLSVGEINLQRTSGAIPDYNYGLVITGGEVVANTVRAGSSNSSAAVSVMGTGALTVTGPMTIAHQATGGRGGALRVLDNATFTALDANFGVILSRKNGSNANNVASATFSGGVSTVEKFTLGYDATVNAGSATININGGAVYIGGGGIVKNGTGAFATNLNFSSGLVGAKADWTTSVAVNLPNNGNVLFKAADAADAPFDIALTGVVGGAGGFTKTGDGTLTLGGDGVTHTFAGTVSVNGGALRVMSEIGASANAVVINESGSLTGNGTIGRALTLNEGGAIAPDSDTAIGMLTAESLTWNGGGTLAIDLGASGASDVLALTGELSKGAEGLWTIALNATEPLAHGDMFDVATFASTTFVPADFTVTGLPDGFAGVPVVTNTKLGIVIVARPVITSALTADGMFSASFGYTTMASNDPVMFSATGLPSGLTIDETTGVISGTPAAAGTYAIWLGATNAAGTGTASLEVTIVPAPVAITLGGAGAGIGPIKLAYDGTPRAPGVSTNPPGVSLKITYNGSTDVPTLPGEYHVVVTADDPNFTGSVEGTLVITITALVRHAPTLNGDLDGSLQLLTGEWFTVNSNGSVFGDLLVPGTPSVWLNGSPIFGGTIDAEGAETPSAYGITLNSGALLRYIVRRVDPIALPDVSAPAAPTGTRYVALNNGNQSAGDFATVHSLTLNGNTGRVVVPPGAYGSLTANGNGSFVLGIAGSTEPAVYELQQLTLNGSNAAVRIIGPVTLKLAWGLALNGALGSPAHPEWLDLQIANGGLTLNGGAVVHGIVAAPNGSVMINGNAAIHGRVSADRLTINSNGLLEEPVLQP